MDTAREIPHKSLQFGSDCIFPAQEEVLKLGRRGSSALALGCPPLLVLAMAMKLFCLALFSGLGAAMELTQETWDSAVVDKAVFVKFQAPW